MAYWQQSQLTISLNFFMGNALTVLDAGLALNTQGSFVNGFTPFRAGVAGFCLSCVAATPNIASTVPFTSFAFKPVDSATDLYAAVAVIGFAPFATLAAFIAFMAFIAFGGNMAALEGIEENDKRENNC